MALHSEALELSNPRNLSGAGKTEAHTDRVPTSEQFFVLSEPIGSRRGRGGLEQRTPHPCFGAHLSEGTEGRSRAKEMKEPEEKPGKLLRVLCHPVE